MSAELRACPRSLQGRRLKAETAGVLMIALEAEKCSLDSAVLTLPARDTGAEAGAFDKLGSLVRAEHRISESDAIQRVALGRDHPKEGPSGPLHFPPFRA